MSEERTEERTEPADAAMLRECADMIDTSADLAIFGTPSAVARIRERAARLRALAERLPALLAVEAECDQLREENVEYEEKLVRWMEEAIRAGCAQVRSKA